jgi:hypothetical protein
MKFNTKTVSIIAVLMVSMCSITLAGFVRFRRPANSGGGTYGGGASTSPVPAPALADTIWTGIGTLTIDKVYFKNTKDQQKTAVVSPTLNCRMEIWFRTATTFTVLVDTTYLDYDPNHRKYEPMLGDQLGLNSVVGNVYGPLYGYRSSGVLDPSKRTFKGDHDADTPPDNSDDKPECTTTVTGSYYFTGTGDNITLVPTVAAAQIPVNTEGVVFDKATCTGVFTKDKLRTVSGELAKANSFVDKP